jgi:cytochrome c-type biogenesis protein CcmH
MTSATPFFRFLWLLIGALVFVGTARSQEAQPLAQDPLVEKRLMAISSELRCLVCQNESLAASNADLAVDLRREIRTMIKADRSDQQILDFLVDRYGDFVRYRPPFKPLTWALWLGPFVLFVLGAAILYRRTRRPTQATEPAGNTPDLSPEQIAKANALLAGEPVIDDGRSL